MKRKTVQKLWKIVVVFIGFTMIVSLALPFGF
jgi:hypothetical protein